MTLLDEEDEPSVAVKETLERLVCLLCQVKLKIDANDARYKLFTEKNLPLPQSLPPSEDGLYLYIKRAKYKCQ